MAAAGSGPGFRLLGLGVMVVMLAGCGPAESRVFIARANGHFSAGAESCDNRESTIKELVLSEGDATHPGPVIWKVRLGHGPAVSRITFGVAPTGYEALIPYRAPNSRRLSVDVSTDDWRGGIATDLSGLKDGQVRWSGGTRTGFDLGGMPKSQFAC